MAMNYLRELLYRPKRSDKSLMARFYFADLNLNAVAQELDSFDGRKDPDRCTCLVNKLRSCQDKLLSICNKMLEEIEPGIVTRSREFRAKFPDDIMTDNLAGQLWFGAECLAAGSSIMHKERESDSMRPLAKAVTKSLEKVRSLLREQCLSPQPEYTEAIRENIKIFDRLFAEFEFAYVQCMVHVKTVREYELQQDLVVLFSDTLQRALTNEMITQEMIDLYEPSLMFAVPRLAIVYGLLVCPDGPLNVDRGSRDFPDLFLPFKNLLRKIKELLLTLAPHEVLVLEMLLCQHEEPANISIKLKEVERMLENREKSEEGRAQADRLQQKLDEKNDPAKEEREDEEEKERERRRRQRRKHRESKEIANSVVRDLVDLVVEVGETRLEQQRVSRHHSEPPPPVRPARRRREIVEIDCTDPEIRVSSGSGGGSDHHHQHHHHRRLQRYASTPSALQQQLHHHSSSSSSTSPPPPPATLHHRRVEVSVVGADNSSSGVRGGGGGSGGGDGGGGGDPSSPSFRHHQGGEVPRPRSGSSLADCASGSPLESYSPRPRQRLKRHNAKRDSRRIPLRYQKDRRAKFKSTEDLLHRLYVCISGAADQLQSNYAGDFRSILKTVFVMNVTRDEDEDEDDGGHHAGEGSGVATGEMLSPSSASEVPFGGGGGEESSSSPGAARSGRDAATTGAGATSALPTSQSLPSTFPRVDLGTDALQEEMSHQLVNEFLPSSSVAGDEFENAVSMAAAEQVETEGRGQGLVYAQNLDLHLQQQERETDPDSAASRPSTAGSGGRPPSPSASFYQPEPTLLDIASGIGGGDGGGGGGGNADGDGSGGGEGGVGGGNIDDEDLPPEARAPESVFRERPVRTPPPWVPDADAPNCMGCSDLFTLFRRRHHCRNCGKVFCGRCSSHLIPLPQFNMHRPVRVCNRCHVLSQFPSPVDADLGSPGGGVGSLMLEDDDEDGGTSPGEAAASAGMASSPWGSRNLGMIS